MTRRRRLPRPPPRPASLFSAAWRAVKGGPRQATDGRSGPKWRPLPHAALTSSFPTPFLDPQCHSTLHSCKPVHSAALCATCLLLPAVGAPHRPQSKNLEGGPNTLMPEACCTCQPPLLGRQCLCPSPFRLVGVRRCPVPSRSHLVGTLKEPRVPAPIVSPYRSSLVGPKLPPQGWCRAPGGPKLPHKLPAPATGANRIPHRNWAPTSDCNRLPFWPNRASGPKTHFFTSNITQK